MTRNEATHIIRISIDVFLLLMTIVAWILVHYAIPQRKSGFYCNDYSISLPYKDSTVTNAVLIVICTVFPILVVCSTEFCRKYSTSKQQLETRKQFKYKIKVFTRKNHIDVPEIIGNIYITLGTYVFGLLVVQFLTNLMKFTIGRPRPHFLDVCKPVYTDGISKPDCAVRQYFQYDVDFKCSNIGNPKRLFDASLSFPSGHSSTVFYTMIFLILYIKYIWKCEKKRDNCGFAILFIQCSLFSVAIFTAISRIIDHKHHITDVIAGSVLGFTFAILIFYLFTEFLSRKNCNLQLSNSFNRLNGGSNQNTDDELLTIQRQQQQQQHQQTQAQQRANTNTVYVETV